MVIKKFNQVLLLLLVLFYWLPSFAQFESPLGQTLQISTRFHRVVGHPTWLLIVRDVQNGQVLPYVFDVREHDNYWVAFTIGRSYRIVASEVKFSPYRKIHNFCHLENGIITGKSMVITISGDLAPDRDRAKCFVTKVADVPFPFANSQ